MNTSQKSGPLIIGVIVVIIIILAIIFGGEGKKDQVPAGETIKVGVILPLTGATSTYGEYYKIDLENSVKDEPGLELIFEDSKSDPAGAVSAFQKVTSVDNVDLVISILSKTSIPLVSLAKEQKVPLLLSLTSAISATSPDNDYVSRIFWTSDDTANLFVKRMLSQKVKNVAIISEKNEGVQLALDIIIPTLEKAGVKVTSESFNDQDTDMRTQLQKLKKVNPEVFAILSVPNANWKNVMTQANEIGLKVPTYDVLGVLLNPGTPEVLGDMAQNIYTFTTAFNLGEYKPETRQEIIAANGKEPAGFSSLAYDTGALLKQLVANQTFEREQVATYIKNLKSFDGITSNYKVDAAHNFIPEIIQAQYVDGKIVKSDK